MLELHSSLTLAVMALILRILGLHSRVMLAVQSIRPLLHHHHLLLLLLLLLRPLLLLLRHRLLLLQ